MGNKQPVHIGKTILQPSIKGDGGPNVALEDIDQREIVIRGVAHDVNNMLMAVLAACDQLEENKTLRNDPETTIETIRTNARAITGLMRDLVRSQSSDAPVIMDKVQLRSFLKGIMPSLKYVAGAKVTIELGSVYTEPVKVHTKPLLRVLMQIIRNVGDVDVSHPLAFISAWLVDGWCEISVADNGPGIIDLDKDDIFKPGITSKDDTGTRGYGLSTVATAVSNWGGQYGVDSIAGDSGCRFWIRLPLADT
ncbi:MAG: sensor histidine kinase [Alphaproteobacteria bacterium]|nr:sensor histidine kinase [Alphaproteobacteria bacterium]